MREIGSEYWLENHESQENITFEEITNIGEDKQLLFSGRTAIELVLEDIDIAVKNVYMPSYCCQSMVQPFIERGISIDFYDVSYDENGLIYSIDSQKKVDVFFACSYFGFHISNMDSIIREFKERNIIIIEDITHRLLSEPNHCKEANYLVASVRKWFPVPSGGLAIKSIGSFKQIDKILPPKDLLNKKIAAMINKAIYIEKVESGCELSYDKSEFLKLYSEFNTKINKNYKRISIDPLSKNLLYNIDIEEVKRQRRENTKYIYNNFKNTSHIRLLFNEFDDNLDCPLFVPILVNSIRRDSLKKFLVESNIFCPSHWPLPQVEQLKDKSEKLYREEVSLICDQRYGSQDVKRIIKTIGDYTDQI